MNFPCYTLIQLAKKGEISIRIQSRDITSQIKKGRVQSLDSFLLNEKSKSLLSGVIDSSTTLVPAPRSAPLEKGFIWPSMNICQKLIEHGYGGEIKPVLSRVRSVPSAHAQDGADNRASVQIHIETMECEEPDPLFTPTKIIIVDDVVTQGRTSTACYKLLEAKYPNTPIAVFAPVRTMSFDEVKEVFAPFKSTIKYFASGKTFVDHSPPPFFGFSL